MPFRQLIVMHIGCSWQLIIIEDSVVSCSVKLVNEGRSSLSINLLLCTFGCSWRLIITVGNVEQMESIIIAIFTAKYIITSIVMP